MMNHHPHPPPVTTPSPPSPQQYPQEIQVKLYQAFIFSTPILFSIIIFLLFYLFYLKRRTSAAASPTTTTTHLLPIVTLPACHSDLKNEQLVNNNKLCIILFDDYMKEPTKDSLCSVCLGELKEEELVQVGECKHVFHAHCIHLWLHSHSTCPLCRSQIHL